MNGINWKSKNIQLEGTSDPNRVVDALMSLASERSLGGLNYRIFSQDNGNTIISNVPDPIYKTENLKQYIAPLGAGSMLRFLDFLQEHIDILQYSDVSDPSALAPGETFQLNQCYNNSWRLFNYVRYLQSINIIPSKKYIIQIVLGYITSKIPFGINIGNIVVENESLTIHDWHAWNYIDNVLIDLSLLQNGHYLAFSSEIPSWGRAKDHVFIIPPNGTTYYGTAYTNLSEFDNTIKVYFEQGE